MYSLIAVVLLVLGIGYGGTQAVTQGIVMSAKEDLESHWRWQYDILVYPKESKEFQGLGDGWVAPQTSIASYGGISIEDWKLIQEIPSVEVAAPLSILGYFEYDHISTRYEQVGRGTVYEIKHEKKVFDGLKESLVINSTKYIDLALEELTIDEILDHNIEFFNPNFSKSNSLNKILRYPN